MIERFWGAPAGGAQPRWDEAMFTAYTLILGEMGAPLPADRWAQAVLQPDAARRPPSGSHVVEELVALDEQVFVIETTPLGVAVNVGPGTRPGAP